MRIAMYHGTLPRPGRKPGGVEVFVHRLSEALSKRGHDVELLSYSAAPAGAAYRSRRLPMRSAEHSRFLRQYVAPWLLNLQRFDGFDVAHFHGDDWFFLRRPLPVVRTFHGSALFEMRSAVSLRRQLDKALIFPLELLAGSLATSSYGVGVDSEIIYQADGLLPLGIDLPDRPRQPTPNPTILFIGTWSGRKRGSFLHDLFLREIRPALPDAELWMVSDACTPADGVRWIHAPTDAELSELFSQASVFCLPSRYEGFGIPYLEAMAHGTPAVASPNTGARMLLSEGRYGVLAEDHELGAQLIALLRDSTRRASLARDGKLRAQEFSWAHMAERHEHAYAQAIERWRAR
ncbi:MAG TPA: glycosyltransferase family 4 protein [Solirubrobacteraceae bacterium]|nr:glycosyltransferase family 4 protein [Solirubrobacteraceae bacterium]